MSNLFTKGLDFIAKQYRNNTSGMIIATGVTGWGLSAIAQTLAILFNSKISDKEKGYLLPQEITDAAVNIGLFIFMTLSAKWLVSNLFSTGKISTKAVREFLNKNKHLYGDKIGKIGFDLGEALKTNGTKDLLHEYEVYKDFGTTLATVGSGIIASNVITPFVRNNNATNMQKKYIDYTKNNPYPVTYSSGMKI